MKERSNLTTNEVVDVLSSYLLGHKTASVVVEENLMEEIADVLIEKMNRVNLIKIINDEVGIYIVSNIGDRIVIEPAFYEGRFKVLEDDYIIVQSDILEDKDLERIEGFKELLFLQEENEEALDEVVDTLAEGMCCSEYVKELLKQAYSVGFTDGYKSLSEELIGGLKDGLLHLED